METLREAWHFLERNPVALAAVVPFLAIVGGIFGNWISAKVQAGGGKAQANAAVEAARIAAAATRIAALRDERRIALAQFIQCTRELLKLSERLYRFDQAEAMKSAHDQLMLARSELELVAPQHLVDLAEQVMEASERLGELALTRGPAARARLALAEVDAGNVALSFDAGVKLEQLVRMRQDGSSQADQEAAQSEALTALQRVTHLTGQQISDLLIDTLLPPLVPLKEAAISSEAAACRALVDAVRVALGADTWTQSAEPVVSV
ncbi:hypothetical protein [Streptomyces tanashiensis]|uniref:Uncharacterized protein n=1 Tax=Streptomyces tanashiensis TaxID=67367 RepID=A0ABY6QZE9_9ACTN|nr:hypothetical protein [Streptomyces tanashiensis]UZX23171.1 hypothetical protein LDH80_21670 [Streptomyces tanashiensis]